MYPGARDRHATMQERMQELEGRLAKDGGAAAELEQSRAQVAALQAELSQAAQALEAAKAESAGGMWTRLPQFARVSA